MKPPRIMKKIEEEILANKRMVETRTGCIYFLFQGDELVYIGKSTHGLYRLYQHCTDKVFDSYSYILCDDEDLDKTEARYICSYKPRLNKAVPIVRFDKSKHGMVLKNKNERETVL
jgi:hypothetical protein